METVCSTNRKAHEKKQVQEGNYLKNERKETEKRAQLSAYRARRGKTAIAHDDFSAGFDAGHEYGRIVGYREAIADVQAILQERHEPRPRIYLEEAYREK